MLYRLKTLLSLLLASLFMLWPYSIAAASVTQEAAPESGLKAAKAQQPGKPTGLLILGDSISAAYGIDKAQGWVALLQENLREQCPTIAVYNASVSGETTAGGVVRLPELLDRFDPALVVIELGGNDGLRGLSPAQMQSNLQKMIRLIRQADAQPVLLGILIPPNYGDAYRQLFKQAIANTASSEQVPLLAFFLAGVAGRQELMQADGLHPTAPAQPQLLTNALQVLEKPLQRICREYTAM